MSERVVIIGAGQTGRGFINRLVMESGEQAVFIEKDADLIENLRNQSYQIRFGEGARIPFAAEIKTIYSPDSQEAIDTIAKAEIVITAIGTDHLTELTSLLEAALKQRTEDTPLMVLLCENGVNAHEKLAVFKPNPAIEISDAIIFCTTLSSGLDIVSEEMDSIPYDSSALSGPINLKGFLPDAHLGTLMKRKIYTYNCLSACIAYTGALYGYTSYAEAACDARIEQRMKAIQDPLDRVVSKEYMTPLAEQHDFSTKAIRKFQNKSIVDTIDRNARNALRKLGRNERIVAPLRLMEIYHEVSEALLEVAAMAYCYGIVHHEFTSEQQPIKMLFRELPEAWIKIIENSVQRYLRA